MQEHLMMMKRALQAVTRALVVAWRHKSDRYPVIHVAYIRQQRVENYIIDTVIGMPK